MAADLHISRTQTADGVPPDGVPGLASFVSEATLAPKPPKSEPQEHPLWEFPEEFTAAAGTSPTARQLGTYGALAAAVVVAAIAGAWWGRSLPSSGPIADPPIAQAVVIPPVVTPSDVASDEPLAELMPSVNLQPSTHPPVARVVPALPRDVGPIASPPPKPVAVSAAASEQRQLPRGTSSARGTTGGRPEPSTQRPATIPPPAEPRPAPPMTAANRVVGSPVASPPALEMSPAAPPPPRVAAAVRPEPEALPPVVARTEQSEIQRALGQYRSAYQLLDAEAARAVWPSVDVRALSRAFDTLASQQLQFDTCQFEIDGAAATAQCRGSATYTPKVGNRAPRLEQRQWTFHLRKVDEGWKIQSAQARR
jgi:hypothetical protein